MRRGPRPPRRGGPGGFRGPGRPPRYRGGCLGCLLPVLGLSFSLVLAVALLICLL